MEVIRMVAIQAIVDQGVSRSQIQRTVIGYPRLTSAVTATFNVLVELVDGRTAYNVPVTTRIEYCHPVALI